MSKYYQPKTIDGEPNSLYKPRNPAWKKQPSGPSGKKVYKSKFDKYEFIGLDGEGGDYNGKHVYQLLAASDGSSIYNERGLTSQQNFDFLLELGRKNKNAVFVIFAGSYDANMWLRDLTMEQCQQVRDADGKAWVWIGDYAVRYVQRKQFAIKHRSHGKAERSVVIWDIHGFFQGSFISVLKAWLPDYQKLDLIVQGKKARTNFIGSDHDFMIEYNAAELEALVLIMQKFRDGLLEMGLVLSRWDGAGAVAMAMYRANDVKDYYADLPDNVQIAAQHAYFGGRIEIGKVGTQKGKIYHYDINSAYPSVQVDLPALAGGQWSRRDLDNINADILSDKLQKLTVCLVKWSGLTGSAFCPFPYRSQAQRKVLFPTGGLNWLWLPEVQAGLKWAEHYPHWQIEILDCYEFYPAIDHKPFGWIAPYYNERQEIVAESKRTGIPNGKEKIIKLGLNSLYGKCAQRVGYNAETGRKPPYHNLAYAGYITSATRAKLFDAAMQSPDSIIAMATDGIYSTKKLELHCPKEKVLGAWEYQTHDEMSLVQAGFYFYRNGDKWVSFSRGFDKMREQSDIIDSLNKIKLAWKKYKGEIYLPCTRFITLKSALISEVWFARWCTWYKTVNDEGIEGRRLQILPYGTKRELSGSNSRADLQLLDTLPTPNYTPDELSMRHTLPWDTEDGIDENTITLEHDIDSNY